MKYRVIGRVAHFHTDAILGLSDDQYRRRTHQLAKIGDGRFIVTGPHIAFKFGEIIDVIDATLGKTPVLEAVGKEPPKPTGEPSLAELKVRATELKIRFGMGIGATTLAKRIADVSGDVITIVKKAVRGPARK